MILEILKFPDSRLREVSKDVTTFDEALETLARNMLDTMYAEHGIGLAAPQVGFLKRMLVIDARPKENGRYDPEDQTHLERAVDQPLVIINPKIISQSGKTTFDEGCLSVPGFFETVERANLIELEYQNLKGEKCRLKTDGLLAIVIQHEMDHLEGTLFVDHLSFLKSSRIKNQIKKNGYPEKTSEKDKVEIKIE